MFLTCIQKCTIHEMCGGRVRCCDLYSSLSNIFCIAIKPNISPLVRDRCRQVKIFSLDTDDGATLWHKFYLPLSVHGNMPNFPHPTKSILYYGLSLVNIFKYKDLVAWVRLIFWRFATWNARCILFCTPHCSIVNAKSETEKQVCSCPSINPTLYRQDM